MRTWILSLGILASKAGKLLPSHLFETTDSSFRRAYGFAAERRAARLQALTEVSNETFDSSIGRFSFFWKAERA
jgi:hypothetical protein